MRVSRMVFAGLGLAFLLMLVLPATAEELSCTRTLPERYSSPGTITVTLNLALSENKPNGLIVREMVPRGWAVDRSAPPFDRFDPATGEVKWLLLDNIPRELELTYTVRVPAGFEQDEATISGKVLFIDDKRTQRQVEIGGDRTMFAE